ncbi:MAG: hypothetical protein U0930_04770 [Pirellulales bacterium]
MESTEELKDTRRTHEQLRRVLMLAQVMSAYRFPKTVDDLWRELQEFYGCKRTLERDLDLLVSTGIASKTKLHSDKRTSTTVTGYRLDLLIVKRK